MRKQKPKSLRLLKYENKRLREIVAYYHNEGMQFVMFLNQLETGSNLNNKDVRKITESYVSAAIENRRSHGLRAFLTPFGEIHDKEGKI